jgi:2-polyprenyl-3-methyl-5-hydroxy-6-metoxy-1,4-benzoquinol methylase
MSPQARARARKKAWEKTWRVESRRRPVEPVAGTVPEELEDAVASGWIPPGSSVLDIGSGRGQISAWLAERGFTVLGVDFADSATELARRHFSGIGPRLRFRTLDICGQGEDLGAFDAFVDRGCFQVVNEPSRYVDNVLSWSKPGSRLLLFHRVDTRHLGEATKETLERGVEEAVRSTFEPYFEVERCGATAVPMTWSAGRVGRIVRPGMVFWMRRS